MNIQDMYDNLDIVERQEFANYNACRIKETLPEDSFITLSGYSKEELLQELSGRNLDEIIDGALNAGVKMEGISTWVEREIRD